MQMKFKVSKGVWKAESFVEVIITTTTHYRTRYNFTDTIVKFYTDYELGMSLQK
jgi:hypothetical protein